MAKFQSPSRGFFIYRILVADVALCSDSSFNPLHGAFSFIGVE